METTVILKRETYSKRIEGHCKCGHSEKIVKFENSNLTIFKHGHRFTTSDDTIMKTNIFRCEKCKEQIELSFIPDN